MCLFCHLGLLLKKYCRLSGLSDRNLFFTILNAGKYKVKAPVNSFSREDLFLPILEGCFLVCLHMVEGEEETDDFIDSGSHSYDI